MKRKFLCVTLVLMICLLAAVPASADIKPMDAMRAETAFSAGHSQGNDGSTYYYGKIKHSSRANMTITVELKNSSGTTVSSATNANTGFTIIAGNTVFLSSGTYTIVITGTVNGSPVSDPSPTQFTI